MTIIKKSAIFFLGIMAVTLNSCRSDVEKKVKSEKETRPNIVLIMADDMGYSDLGCYGSEINTPNLDRLAKNGLRYTQFYNTSRCCPTRASLLTGLYPHQTGLGWMTRLDLGKPGYTGQLNDQCVTLGEVLKQAGYSTYISGKWHVNKDDECEQDSPRHNWPLHRGFDRFFGMLKGSTDILNLRIFIQMILRFSPVKIFILQMRSMTMQVSLSGNIILQEKRIPFSFM
jgi:arylsulfatase